MRLERSNLEYFWSVQETLTGSKACILDRCLGFDTHCPLFTPGVWSFRAWSAGAVQFLYGVLAHKLASTDISVLVAFILIQETS